MRTLGAIFGATAALAACVAPATAADLYNQGGLKDGPAAGASQYNWTGFYIGGYLGGHFNNTTLDFPSGPASLDGIGSQGLMGGGEIGLDFQASKLVFGIFGRSDFPTAETTLTFGTNEIKDSMNYMWTAGARGGFLASPSTLIFAELGYSQAQYAFTTPSGIGGPNGISWTRTPGGITAGVGIEAQLGGGFSAKLVYDWTGLDSVDVPPAIAGQNNISVTTDIQRVQAGIDYKLNVGRLPLN